ncbi:MAG: hypothetical protein ACI4AE_02655 [Candidatus Cryptobacteroides sp.]
MPLEEYTADTLRTLPAPDAFVQALPARETSAVAVSAGPDMGVCTAVSVCVILFILCLNKFMRVFPYVGGGFFRWRLLENIEDSVSLSRDRTTVACALIPLLCTIYSLYGVCNPAIVREFPSGLKCLAITGLLAVILLLRAGLCSFMRPRSVSSERGGTVDRLIYDFMILLTAVCAATVGIASATGVGGATVRTVLFYETVFFFAVLMICKVGIGTVVCTDLKTFLYLCTSEIFTAGMMVAISVL